MLLMRYGLCKLDSEVMNEELYSEVINEERRQ